MTRLPLGFASLAQPAPEEPSPRGMQIRVRITQAVPSIRIRGFDLRIYDTQKSGSRLAVSADRGSEWEMTCQEGKVRVWPIRNPFKSSSLHLEGPVSVRTPVGFLQYAGQTYRNELKIYPVGMECEVVNEVDLEKYLDGLVNSEFSSKWNEESIAAQVVVARTYAYYQILEARNKKTAHFDVEASIKDQVYLGSTLEDFHSSRMAEKTQGLILTTGPELRPLPIKAFYHSTCGGVTELPENVWGSRFAGFKRHVPCPFCVDSPRLTWSLDLLHAEVIQAIQMGYTRDGRQAGWPKNALEILKHGDLSDLKIKSTGLNERVSQLIMVWTDGKNSVELPVSGVRWRDWIGTTRLRSVAFQVIKSKEKKWHFQGRGNGHGVGMCQWGAKAMGEKGNKMAAILKYYYPDANVRKLW